MRKLIVLLITVFQFVGYAQSNFKIENNELILPSPIVFKTASDVIDLEASKASLDHIKAYLEAKSYISLIRIEAHSDNIGNENKNLELCGKRAKAVVDHLVKQGIDCKRLIGVAFGSSKPVSSNDTPEGRAQNRRINIINTELKNHAIGGMPIDGGGVISATCR
jgi:OOP family OmpA-OmpF porin